MSWFESIRNRLLSINNLQKLTEADFSASGYFLINFEKQDCDEIVTNPPHCSGLSYRMSWEEQRRIGLRRIPMDEEEISRRLTKVDQLMNQLIFAVMQTGM